jgi:predicted  nucleic acid-binding Zn-ribbon protein
MDRPPGGWNDLVTNQSLAREMDALRAELRGEMGELRAELRGEMGELRAELRGEMAEMRTEMRGSLRSEIAELSASIDRRLRAQTWITTTTMLTGMGLVAAFTRL